MFDDIPPFLCEGGDEDEFLQIHDDRDYALRKSPKPFMPNGNVILLEAPIIDQIVKNLESIDTKLRLAARLLKKGEEEKKAWHMDLMTQLRNYFLVLEKEKALTTAQNMYWQNKDVGTVVVMAWREAFGKSLPIREQLMPFKCAKCKLNYPFS